MGNRSKVKKPQVKTSHYFNSKYNNKERFISYWYQINEILKLKPKKILEIGIGNAFVADYLKDKGLKVTTLDIDKKLKPDIVANVLKIPVRDNRFELVSCFEVLEHLSYHDVPKALKEIRRVCKKNVILSLPDASRYTPLFRPAIKKFLKTLLLQPEKLKPHRFGGQHYWELGKRGYPLERFIRDLRSTGFKIKKTFRPEEIPHRRFFILRKSKPVRSLPLNWRKGLFGFRVFRLFGV